MSTLYELYSKRTKYRTLRENIANAIDILSRVDVTDNLSVILNTLESNYVVNDVACRSAKVKKISDDLSSDISNLNSCLSAVNLVISRLNREIEEKEAAGSA